MQKTRLINLEQRIRRMGGFQPKEVGWTVFEVEVEDGEYIYQGQRMTQEAFRALPEVTQAARLVVVELSAGNLEEG